MAVDMDHQHKQDLMSDNQCQQSKPAIQMLQLREAATFNEAQQVTAANKQATMHIQCFLALSSAA